MDTHKKDTKFNLSEINREILSEILPAMGSKRRLEALKHEIKGTAKTVRIVPTEKQNLVDYVFSTTFSLQRAVLELQELGLIAKETADCMKSFSRVIAKLKKKEGYDYEAAQ